MTISSSVLIKMHLYTKRNKNETKVLEKVRFITVKMIIIENRYLICDKFYVIIMIQKELLINVKVVPKIAS